MPPSPSSIIFQPELRRILAELGTHPLFNANHDQRENIEVIIQTVERLADVRIGALIAIEQSIQLQEATESGLLVDCEATPEMLETIFFPNNAIHDGGVIIKGDRIAYAACIFPLSQRQDLAAIAGHAPSRRHRACRNKPTRWWWSFRRKPARFPTPTRASWCAGVTGGQLRAFLSSVLLNPASPTRFCRWLQPARAGAGQAPAGPRPKWRTNSHVPAPSHFSQFLAKFFHRLGHGYLDGDPFQH